MRIEEHGFQLGLFPEMSNQKITYETCVGGQATEWIYVVTSEEWNMDREAFMGYLYVTDDRFNHFETRPVQVSFDGLAYINRIDEEKVIEVIGKEMLDYHKARMHAIHILGNGEAMKPKKKITVWENPQDNHWERDPAPEGTETFEVTEREFHDHLQATNFDIEMMGRSR